MPCVFIDCGRKLSKKHSKLMPTLKVIVSAFDEWENQIITLSDDSDDDDEDVDLLHDDAAAEASIFARGKIIIEAEKKFLKWKAIGDASNRRGFGNSRASYYRALQQNENLKSKAMGSKDIRDFFIEEEDTNDEMAHPLVDRQSNKRGKVASSALSMEEALEIALSLAKVTRNKKQEAKSGIMAWEKMRAIAVVEYLKMRLSNIGKMVASAKCTINVYKNGGTKNYKARSVRFWADQ